MTATTGAAYQYDYENRLKRAEDANGVTTFKYDPFGRRIEKAHTPTGGATTTTRYFYDNEDVLVEYENGALKRRYVHGLRFSVNFQSG
jgi:YD repeat-containing protein